MGWSISWHGAVARQQMETPGRSEPNQLLAVASHLMDIHESGVKSSYLTVVQKANKQILQNVVLFL